MLTICVPQKDADIPTGWLKVPGQIWLFPESGIHPAKHGEIVETALSKGVQGGIMIVTYSKVICLYVLWLVRHSKLSHKDVEFWTLHVDGSTEVIPLDEQGRFTEDWPGGFFIESFDLLLS